jgi:hypothetical protein
LLDQHTEYGKCTRADRHRHELSPFVAPKQTAAAPVETEVIEQKNIV